MKPLPLSQFKITAALGLFLVFQSCVSVPGSWKNEKISSGKRDDFHQLNTEALTYLKANNPKGLKALLSKEMIADNNERQVELISNRLTDNPYELLDEFYVVNKFIDKDTIPRGSQGISRYGLIYPSAAKEMYFAFFAPKKPANKYMVSIVYAKLNYGWKIVKLGLAPYTINGKTAPELFALAKDQYDKKYIQAALNNVTLAVTCYEPGLYWQYADQADAGLFYTKVHEEVNEKYKYPLVLKQLATGPMILRVYNKDNDEGSFPLIYYMTHFPLKDTDEVKKENLQIRKVVDQLMPGLGENNKYILYSAFNKQPTGYVTVDHFDMTEKMH
jgi:hypothetical protein